MSELILTVAERVCTLLDNIPCREDGRWYRHGDWGRRIGIYRRTWQLARP